MIKYFKIDSLKYTPFDEDFIKEDFKYLKLNGLELTNNQNEAHLFIGYDSKKIKKFILKNLFQKPILLWTNEPRLSAVLSPFYRPYPFLSKVHVMNVYTKDVFINNVTYQENRFSKSLKLNLLQKDVDLTNKTVVALMSYYNAGKNSSLIIDGENIDLVKTRSNIGIYGHKNKKIDIYGKGWPNGLSKEDSRRGEWGNRKSIILQDYNFNLCFENTVYPNYITEKIWDSVGNYCLPIYYGGVKNTIYEIFPKDSFIDYSCFESPKALFQFIDLMSNSEFIVRLNKCITVYNKFVDFPISYWKDEKKIMLDNITKKVNQIIRLN
jgi:hypothetical protein